MKQYGVTVAQLSDAVGKSKMFVIRAIASGELKAKVSEMQGRGRKPYIISKKDADRFASKILNKKKK